jgi:membrane protein DedA with SNARE-associated domain
LELQDIVDWMRNFAIQYGYFGIFLISLLGASSLFIPIPSTVVIFILGGLQVGNPPVWAFEPILIAVAAGAGAAIGEFSGYLLGMGGRKIISEKYKKKMDTLMRLFKKFGPITIFLFAFTPLPDDLLFIPLGVIRYGIVRALIPALLGKILSNLVIAYSGRLSLSIIRDIFGVEGEGMSFLIGTVIAIVLLIIVFVIMFKVDWEKRVEKYLGDSKETDRPPEDAPSENKNAQV